MAKLETDAGRVDPPRGTAPLVIAAAVVLLAATAVSLWASAAGYVRTPFSDAHDWAADLFGAEAGRDWLAYLWAPHGHQRIPLARLVEALDIEAGHGRAPSFLIAAWLALATGLAALLVTVGRSRPPAAAGAWVACLAGLLLVNVAAAEALALPAFAVYPFVAGPALAALASLEWADAGGSWAMVILAAAFALIAGCGDAAGLAVWPALVAAALWRRSPAVRVALLAVMGAAAIALFEAGLGAPARSVGGQGFAAPAHLAKMAAYFASYVGLPWTRSVGSIAFATAIGLIVAAAAVWAGLRAPGGEDGAGRIERLGRAMILFGLLTAVLAAVGRVDEFPEPLAPVRYEVFACLIQAGAVLCWLRPIERMLVRWPRGATAVFAAVALTLLALQVYGARKFQRTAGHIRAASAAFDRGDRSSEVLALVYPDAGRAASIRAQLKQRGLPY